MYKVKHEDIIPSRTDEEVMLLQDKLCGSNPKAAKKAYVLLNQFQALTKNMTRDRVIEVVELAHKISDLANADSTKNAVCAKGCSYCCQVNVDISGLEAAYIEVKTGREVKQTSYHLKPGNKLIEYCPFHNSETSLCDIWEFRPIACRGFFAFDNPELCVSSDNVHAISSAWNIPATKQLMEVLEHCCGGEVGDIRSYFK